MVAMLVHVVEEYQKRMFSVFYRNAVAISEALCIIQKCDWREQRLTQMQPANRMLASFTILIKY
jgi:hypothetical protein